MNYSLYTQTAFKYMSWHINGTSIFPLKCDGLIILLNKCNEYLAYDYKRSNVWIILKAGVTTSLQRARLSKPLGFVAHKPATTLCGSTVATIDNRQTNELSCVEINLFTKTGSGLNLVYKLACWSLLQKLTVKIMSFSNKSTLLELKVFYFKYM